MWITPHNYLLSDPSRQSKQMIHIELDDEGVATGVDTYGAEAVTGGVDFVSTRRPYPDYVYFRDRRWELMENQAQIEWDASTYTGDVAIRKFPYDRE
jgi:primary-amine oxidase